MAKNNRLLKSWNTKITNSYSGGHKAIDVVGNVSGPGDDDILAHSAGTVVFCQTGIPNDTSAQNNNRSYGNCVKIKHANGYSTLYAHMSTVYVSYGAKVEKGQAIGHMGNTGNSYGVHLHWEVRNTADDRIDPTNYQNADLPGLNTGSQSDSSSGKKYSTGTYKVTCELLNVRKGAGTNYAAKKFSELTANAQSQIKKLCGKAENGLVKGVVTDVTKIFGDWGQTASGWINMQYVAKASASTSSPTAKKYSTGTYKVNTAVLNVRKGAGTSYAAKNFSELSANAQSQIKKLVGGTANGFVKGMICDVSEVKDNWGKTPSGWICLDYCIKQ